jgi:hypothetical protein
MLPQVHKLIDTLKLTKDFRYLRAQLCLTCIQIELHLHLILDLLKLEQQASKLNHDCECRPRNQIAAFLSHSRQKEKLSSFAKSRV